MVNISQRIQFVGKQNKVFLSEFVDINHMFLYYAFTQWKSIYVNPKLLQPLCIVLTMCFWWKTATPTSFLYYIMSNIWLFRIFTLLTYDNFWTRPFWNLKPLPIFLLSIILHNIHKFINIHLVTQKILNVCLCLIADYKPGMFLLQISIISRLGSCIWLYDDIFGH